MSDNQTINQNHPFYLIDNISYRKENIDNNTISSYYNAFLTNRSFSYHVDSLIYANEMNRRYDLDKDMQYSFYLNSLRARKRLAKWSKTRNEEQLKTISEHFNYSYTKSRQVLGILTNEQIDAINNNKETAKGGIE